ncbi:MOSC domain-containing protein, partial [Xanthomonas perforans]
MTMATAEQGAPIAIRIDHVAIGSARVFRRPG